MAKKRNASMHKETSSSVRTITGSRRIGGSDSYSPKSCGSINSSNSGSFRVVPIVAASIKSNRVLPIVKEVQNVDEEAAMTDRKDLVAPDQAVSSSKKVKPTSTVESTTTPQASFSSIAATGISITRRMFGSSQNVSDTIGDSNNNDTVLYAREDVQQGNCPTASSESKKETCTEDAVRAFEME